MTNNNSLYKKIGAAIHAHRLKFFQLETESATYVPPGTTEAMSQMLGVRITYTPEHLIHRVALKFSAKCQFISYKTFRPKVEQSKIPGSNVFVLMDNVRYSKPDFVD